MAQSNRGRVNDGFEILAQALDAFLTRVIAVDDNSSWIDILELTDNQRSNGRGRQEYSATDPQCSLRFITEGTTNRFRSNWWPLRRYLDRPEEALASELRETRNLWAHNAAFNVDDTYRALDTMQRLATAIKDKKSAEELAAQRNGVRIIQGRKEDEETSRTADINISGDNLQPWRQIVTPHPDVANGTFNASGFAADLHTVATLSTNDRHRSTGRHSARSDIEAGTDDNQVSAGADYTDPQRFFDRTYLTEGLKDLLTKALRRTAGDTNASPVINLQTNFGGGKTHSMLAVWHLFGRIDRASLPQDMQDLLATDELAQSLAPLDGQIPSNIRRVALVGTELVAAGKMTKPDGTVVNTIWGELAWQLGGAEAYEIVKDSDLSGTNPGENLRHLLESHGPAVILIDEWVAYARQLVGRTGLAGGDLSTQQTFAQSLAQAVAATPQCMLMVSIPASAEMKPGEYVDGMVDDEEIGGANGREALTALLQIINRQAEQWRPAESNESFEIVRRRIFEEVSDSDQEKIRLIAQTMRTFYAKNEASFPPDAVRPDYASKIERCYPIHPELFDRLYQDWATLPRFQRTRGVLRLMSTIVSELWRSENNSPLILPSDVPIGKPSVTNELAQYLDDNWKPVISTDVDGTVPHDIDNRSALFGPRRVTTRLARTVFFGAAPRTRGTGIESRYITLGTAVPGDKIGNFHSALSAMSNRSTHFYENNSQYWFDTATNITSEVRERAEALSTEDINGELSSRLQALTDEWNRTHRNSVKVLCTPASNGDILDEEQLRLVVVPPTHPVDSGASAGAAGEWARSATNNVGLKPRTFKNTVVFLAADARRIESLSDGVRQYLAWSSVQRDREKLDLTQSTASQAATQSKKTAQTVDDRLMDTYQWVLEPVKSSDSTYNYVDLDHQAIHGGNDIIQRAIDKLQAVSAFATQQAPTLIANALIQHTNGAWQRTGHYRFGNLWDMYPKYLYMQRVLNRRVVEEGLRYADGGTFNLDDRPFAFADDVTVIDSEDFPRYENLRWPEDGSDLPPGALPNSLLVVTPDAARAQFRRDIEERQRQMTDATDGPDATTGDGSGSSGVSRGDQSGGGGETTGTGERPGDGNTPGTVPTPGASTSTRFTATFELPVSGGVSRYAMIDDEVLSHLRDLASAGGAVSITVDVEATDPDGFSPTVQKMINGSIAEMSDADGNFE